jgi:hypothetical protein
MDLLYQRILTLVGVIGLPNRVVVVLRARIASLPDWTSAGHATDDQDGMAEETSRRRLDLGEESV